MGELLIRPCELDDLDQLVALARKTFREAFEQFNTPENTELYLEDSLSHQKLEAELKDKGSDFYFAYHHDELIGYMKLNRPGSQTDVNKPGSIELERIYILSEFQGRKYGFQLLQKAIGIGKAQKMSTIWLGVWDQNHGAIRFYERHGFRKTRAHDFYFGKEKQTDYLLELSL